MLRSERVQPTRVGLLHLSPEIGGPTAAAEDGVTADAAGVVQVEPMGLVGGVRHPVLGPVEGDLQDLAAGDRPVGQLLELAGVAVELGQLGRHLVTPVCAHAPVGHGGVELDILGGGIGGQGPALSHGREQRGHARAEAVDGRIGVVVVRRCRVVGRGATALGFGHGPSVTPTPCNRLATRRRVGCQLRLGSARRAIRHRETYAVSTAISCGATATRRAQIWEGSLARDHGHSPRAQRSLPLA